MKLSIENGLSYQGSQPGLVLPGNKQKVGQAPYRIKNFSLDVIEKEHRQSSSSMENITKMSLFLIAGIGIAYFSYFSGRHNGFEDGWESGKKNGYDYGSALAKKICELSNRIKKPWFLWK